MLEKPTVTSFAINPEGGPDIIVEGCSRFIREDEFEGYRAWVATALAEARAEGRRQGLEAAAEDLKRLAGGYARAVGTDREQRGDAEAAIALTAASRRILATNTPETQKPETGESDG